MALEYIPPRRPAPSPPRMDEMAAIHLGAPTSAEFEAWALTWDDRTLWEFVIDERRGIRRPPPDAGLYFYR